MAAVELELPGIDEHLADVAKASKGCGVDCGWVREPLVGCGGLWSAVVEAEAVTCEADWSALVMKITRTGDALWNQASESCGRYKTVMKRIAAAVAGLLVATPMAARAEEQWKVTPQWLYEGNYLVQRQYKLDGVVHQRAFILDCPTGTWSFWNPIVSKAVTRPLNVPSPTPELERICIRRWGQPGIGLK